MVNTMENAEEVMQVLDRFTRLKQKEIPKELDDYLQYVAKTGDTVFKWSSLKYLFREKLLNVIKAFHDNSPRVDEIPQYPNVDPFNYESMKSSLLERLELFNAAPFTIQRLCELLIDPRKQYSRIDKFMRALEKNILVVSTVEPGRKRTESENGDSLDSVVNGDLSLDVNVDIDMVENEALFVIETQNGNGAVPAAVVAAVVPDNLIEAKEKLTPVSSDVGNNAVRNSDDDVLPHPKKAKLEHHDSPDSKANNGEQPADHIVVASVKMSDANGSAEMDKKKDVEKMAIKEDAKIEDKKDEKEEKITKPAEENGNAKIEEKECAKILKIDSSDVEMADSKVVDIIKTAETPAVVAKVMSEKVEKVEVVPAQIIEEKVTEVVQGVENEKNEDKEIREQQASVESKAVPKASEVESKANEKISENKLVVEVVVEQKPKEICVTVEKEKENNEKPSTEVLVENKPSEVCEQKNETKFPKEGKIEEKLVETASPEKANDVLETEKLPNEQKTPPTAKVEEKENIVEEKVEAEVIPVKAAVAVEETSKPEAEKPLDELPKQVEESNKEEEKVTVQEKISAATTEEKVDITVDNEKMAATEVTVANIEKTAEAVLVKSPEIIEEKKLDKNVEAVAPPTVAAVDTAIVEAATTTAVKPLAEAKTEKPSENIGAITDAPTSLVSEIVAEAPAATITSLTPQTTITVDDKPSVPLICELPTPTPTLAPEAIVVSAEVAPVTPIVPIVPTASIAPLAVPSLEPVAIISEPVLPTTNDIIAPTLALNDQPMEDLPMDEAVPEEVIMAETVAVPTIGSVLAGSGLVEMATDAMEASSKDELLVDGMDVDDTSQEAMDQ